MSKMAVKKLPGIVILLFCLLQPDGEGVKQ